MFEKISGGRLGGARQALSSGVLVLAAHGVIGAAAVWATLRPQVATGTEHPPLVLPWPAEPDHDRLPAAPDGMADPSSPVLDLPTESSIGLPPIDRGTPFDPTQWLHAGVVVGSASGKEAGPLSAASVDELPLLLAGPAPRYPEGLRRAGIEGRVVVETVVDTLGRAEPSSVVIVATPRPGFAAPARDYVMRAVFRPARVHGRAVRVLVRVPIDFAITTAR